jgi:nucleoid DNA-binding protein|tara:strand:+ start:3023 stop:3298 length:276 start_codon:yes stop_codon:yes gene_type:complete
MNITKKDISKKIAHNSEASLSESVRILDKFIEILSSNLLDKSIKIGRFGTFQKYQTKERIGRNPKTLKSYIIKPIDKIKLNISNKVKETIN